MALEHWSSSASGNASPTGINFAEGQAPSTVNNSAREMMAQVRKKYYATEWIWIKNSATASVATQTTFKVGGDQTGQFEANRRVRLTGGSATRYGSITSASYTTETTVTIVVDSGSLSASMSVVAISAVDQNATPAAAAVAYLTSNSASIMIAAAAMPLTGGVFTGPVGHSATTSFSGAAQFNAGVSISGALTVAGVLTHKGSASFSNSVHFRAPVEFSGTASFNSTPHFKSSASFSGSAHFRGPVEFSGTVSFIGSVNVKASASFSGSVNFQGSTNFLSSASFSGSVNFAGGINVSATASVGALTVAGVAVSAPAAVTLGTGSATGASQLLISWTTNCHRIFLHYYGKGNATTNTVRAFLYTDGGTTPFLSVFLPAFSATASDIAVVFDVTGANARSGIKTLACTSVYVNGLTTQPSLSSSVTANAGVVNAIGICLLATGTTVTQSSAWATVTGWT